MSFTRNMDKKYGQNISKNISSQKLLEKAELKLETASKIGIQKTAEATGNLIGNKTDKITRVSKTSPQINSVTNEDEILRERCISAEKRQQIINDLKLI